jgi:hypothetical protein
MNRKLQHTMKALSATAAVFSLMLIAGGPAPVPAPTPVPAPAVLLVISAEAAGTAVDAIEQATDKADPTQRKSRRSRASLALPYFSFAQGLRQVAGS